MKHQINEVHSYYSKSKRFCFFLVINFDAKLSFDDNAKFRQSNVFDMEDTAESDQREVEATRAGLNYIGLQGNIGCLGIYQLNKIYSLKLSFLNS